MQQKNIGDAVKDSSDAAASLPIRPLKVFTMLGRQYFSSPRAFFLLSWLAFTLITFADAMSGYQRITQRL
jgi:hypothetical protein